MRTKTFFLILLSLLISCCSVKNPIDYFEAKIYKLDVQQGNIITAEMLMGLKPGMTQAQVRYVLGTPLIQDSFHKNRWDYIYKMIKDDQLIEERHLVVKFEDDELVDIKGDLINKDDVMLGAQMEKQSKVITLTKEDYEEQKKDTKSILSRLNFWDSDAEVKENSQTIKISKKDYEGQEKDQSLLSRLKFWDDDPEPSAKDIKIETSSKENKVMEVVKQIEASEDEEKVMPSVDRESDKKIKTVEKEYKIDDEQSVSQSVKEDIIKSLPDEADPAYFELLLEKIGF
ncbi:MAG: outer membrane protein assembly factor BamE [Proteobacteria bacterium]|nr:outer membrane protein assembly factor BamE [Pseudomonadota bacterium]